MCEIIHLNITDEDLYQPKQNSQLFMKMKH